MILIDNEDCQLSVIFCSALWDNNISLLLDENLHR